MNEPIILIGDVLKENLKQTVILEGDKLLEHDRMMKLYEESYENIRNQRNTLLTQTDKYLILDFPIDSHHKSQWLEYRERLRIFPETCRPVYEETGELISVEWPTPPSNIVPISYAHEKDLQTTRTQLEVTTLKLLNTEARLGMIEQTMTSILSKLNV